MKEEGVFSNTQCQCEAVILKLGCQQNHLELVKIQLLGSILRVPDFVILGCHPIIYISNNVPMTSILQIWGLLV